VAEGVYVEATESLDPAVTFNVVVFGGEDGWKGIKLFFEESKGKLRIHVWFQRIVGSGQLHSPLEL